MPTLLDYLTPHKTLTNHNLDQQLTRITRPDHQIVDFSYEATTGKLKDIVLPEGTQTLTYSSTTGQLTHVTYPNGSQLAYTYQGSLLQSETWSGLLSGRVQRVARPEYSEWFVDGNNLGRGDDGAGL